MGGFAGDLQRLYPIQSSKMFPLRKAITPYKGYVVIRPLLIKEKSQIKHFMQTMSDSTERVPNNHSLTKLFATSIADQNDSMGYIVEDGDEGGVLAFLVATKHVSSLLKQVKKGLQSQSNGDSNKVEKFDALNKSHLVGTFTCINNMYYTKALTSMFETFFDAHHKDICGLSLVVDKFESLALDFLTTLNMHKSHESSTYLVVKKS